MTEDDLAEERLEARAVHGPGVELVDVFTGKNIAPKRLTPVFLSVKKNT